MMRGKRLLIAIPIGRQKLGVRRYQILRSTNDSNYVMIDLEFDTQKEAEALLAAMKVVWGRVEGTVMTNPKSQIAVVVETIFL
jgi:hypothetical protein